MIGTAIGPYRILDTLGEGGMGVVYRARDLRLNRDVALKVLPEAFASDPERLARFRREAQVLAALNHPNIAAIYGLEESEGIHALVLELVEGPTLAERIRRPDHLRQGYGGPPKLDAKAEGLRLPDDGSGRPSGLQVDEALAIARQIAEALEAAHELGITHRDLKPANIKVTPDGVVKVLDFGLAKLAQASGSWAQGTGGADPLVALTQSPTVAGPGMMTGVGVILGTAPYMAPEQAKGRPADKRSDVWAFGCVLYEMLTGKRAFEGADISETLAAILMRDPDWSALPANVPSAVAQLLRRCLERDRRKRVSDIAAALFVLDERSSATVRPGPAAPSAQALAKAETEHDTPARAENRWRRAVPVATAVVLTAAITGAAAWWATRAEPPHVTRTVIATSGPAALTIGGATPDLVITPDGRRVVYAGDNGTQLFVRALDELEPMVLATAAAASVFISPDGQWVGFYGNVLGIRKVAISGGPPTVVTDVIDGRLRGATWTVDDAIIYATDAGATGLMRVLSAGGEVTVLTRPDSARGDADHLWPEMLPDGRGVLFTITPVTGGVDAAQIAVLDSSTGTQKILVRGGTHARYVRSGHLVYQAGQALRAVAFDLDRLETRGTPATVLPRVATTTFGATDVSIADTGTLVYVDAPGGIGGAARTLVWVDRTGREQPIAAPPRAYMHPRISPDGTRVALWADDQENDIWVWSLERATLTRFTFDPGLDNFPAWTPDGRRLVFSSGRAGGTLNLYWQTADGTGTAARVTESTDLQFLSGVSPDGRWAIFAGGTQGNNDVAMAALTPETRDGPSSAGSAPPRGSSAEVRPLVQTRFEERNGIVSPDGRWLAYESNASGRLEVYVRPFPNAAEGQWQVSTAGGGQPVWARTGAELFYFALDGTLMAVPVEVRSAAWNAGVPAKILDARYFTGGLGAVTLGRTYDVSPDGRRFLMIKQGDAGNQTAAPQQIIVVQNWDEELRRLVPVD